ncbi:MAG: hypothetical protein GX596_05950 [Propionibacterium sp.]|nr:hypothetical protein [Propionibacterium sp.]
MSAPVARRAAPPASPWRASSRPVAWAVIDAVALLVLSALVALAFYPVYGTWYLFVAVVGFAAVGMGVSLLAAIREWAVGPTVLAAVAAWFLFGGLLTMPSSSIASVIPTPRVLLGLLTAPVTAWRDMLTLDPPIGETFNLLAVPGLVGFLIGLVGFAIGLRSNRPTTAWVPPALGFVVGALFGSTVALWPLWVGLAFFAVVLVWTTARRSVLRDRLSSTPAKQRPLRFMAGVAMIGIAGLVGVTLTPLLADSAQRHTLRTQVEIPIDLREHRSPLQAFRANISKHRLDTLFEVRGAAPGDIIRVATLDAYDGIAYRVATLDDEAVEETTFRRVGQWIDDDGPGEAVHITVAVHGYEGVWVPTIGRTTAVQFEGDRAIELGENFYYNHASGTGVGLAGLTEGDFYSLEALVEERPPDGELREATAGTVRQPRVTDAPEQIRLYAQRWAEGIRTAGAQALALETNLRQGFFSHGQADEVTSVPGHSQHRLAALLTDAELMIGDHEQYAVAMALMARELGIPSRVVYGYEMGASPVVTGDDVGAWPELQFAEHGWVRFDPTPPEDRTADDVDPPEPPLPHPYIENPPPPPLKPDLPPPDEQLPIDRGEPPAQETTINWAQVGAVVLITGIPLLTIVVPIALILGLKWRRRARRRGDPVIANRVAGAWLELVDKARELGRSPSVSATRSEQADQLVKDFPRMGEKSDPIALAKEADWLVFAPGDPAEGVAREYWRESASARTGMRKSVGFWRWAASALSTKSFRKVK